MSHEEWVPVLITIDPIEELIRSQTYDDEIQIIEPEPQIPSYLIPEPIVNPFKLTSYLFLDTNVIRDYECIICQNLAENPCVHKQNTSCKVMFCSS